MLGGGEVSRLEKGWVRIGSGGGRNPVEVILCVIRQFLVKPLLAKPMGKDKVSLPLVIEVGCRVFWIRTVVSFPVADQCPELSKEITTTRAPKFLGLRVHLTNMQADGTWCVKI